MAPTADRDMPGDSGTEWFWRIVDADGLGDVPSDEEAALRLLCRRAAQASQLSARVRELEEALKGVVTENQIHWPAEVRAHRMHDLARSALSSPETEKQP